MQKRTSSGLKSLVFCSILAAMSIILGKYLAFNIGVSIRISFENLPTLVAGIFLGPWYGLAVGAVADLVGSMMVGYAINPIITLGAASVGFVSGIISLLFKGKNILLKSVFCVFCAHTVGSLMIKTFGIWLYYSSPFIPTLAWRALTYLIVGAAECAAIVLLSRNKLFASQMASMRPKKLKKEIKMTYNEALEYIHSVCWKGSRPGLERITELCARLGDPQKELKFIHVTGTNGKGSTCAMTESILRAAGYRTGLFTSPYVKEFNERMAINGENVSNERLAHVTEAVKVHADAMEDSPTEFELITAIAFVLFKLEKCDIVVLEAGMGGRLDSTNVIESAEVSVITGVALEHTEYLGDTLAKIAYEKAGIIKNGCPVLFGGHTEIASIAPENGEKSVLQVIGDKAGEKNSRLYTCDYSALSVKEATLNGSVLDYKEHKNIKLPLLGLYQPENCAKALEIISIMREKGYKISDEAIVEGLEKVVWRARFERLMSDPLVLYDGSHNPEGIEQAVRTIKHYFGESKVNILTGVMKDKDYTYMAHELAPYANEVFTVTPDNPRSLPAEELSAVYDGLGVRSSAFNTVESGVSFATKKSRADSKALICLGSLYMYAEVAGAIEKIMKNE